MLKKVVEFLNFDPLKYKKEIQGSVNNRVEAMTEMLIDSFDSIFYFGSYLKGLKIFAQEVIAVGGHMIGFKFPENCIAEGEGSVSKAGPFLAKKGYCKALIMTDKNLVACGHVKKLTDSLEKAGMQAVVYDGVVPDPTVENVEAGYKLYHENGCDVVIALGGGSPIDAAKAVAGRVMRPSRTANHMGGVFGVTLPDIFWALIKPKDYPKVMCIPTTSGTGAETTFSAVITNRRTRRKYTINDFAVQPDYSILDPELTYTVDPDMTALTGIDALSHCVEAYVGWGHSRKSDKLSREGIKLVFDNLDGAVKNEPIARKNMIKAGHIGGQVLISGYTTYVHPFAHKVGALTHITHGYLIGSFMPAVLEYYRPQADRRLAQLADLIGVGQGKGEADKAEAFIQAIRDLCAKYGIDGNVPVIASLDYNDIIKSIRTEAFAYPVPKIMPNEDIVKILNEVAGV